MKGKGAVSIVVIMLTLTGVGLAFNSFTKLFGPIGGPVREIVLVARGMAFFLESDPATPNPTIRVTAGERVRIVLKNEDRGFVHDFAVPAADEAVDQINWNESSASTFAMPATPGSYEYVCQPHRLMMSGTLIVE